ncbi:MAG TPA: hypothetical protein P5092_18465 [Ruminococcus sp.]|nr:hypothetical protein [Ruminococcus sp.]
MKRLIATKRSSPTLTHSESKKSIVTGWLRILIGLLIYSFGVYLTIYANIGLAPWDCLGMGITKHTPLNYGSSMVLIGVCAIVIQLILRERIGFATLFDALITGRLTQFFIDISPYPENHSLWLGIVFMLFGFLFIALGMYVYMSAECGCGPKDGLLVAIGKRMQKIPIGVVEMLLWTVVTLIGWLLGGTVGIGTVISTFGAGAVMHLFYTVIHFEPRKLQHRSIKDTFSILFDWG